MNYPKNYAVLAADEMEYTTGGSVIGVVLAVGGLAGTIAASVVYNNKLNQIAAELKAQNPEEYSDPDDILTDAWKSKKLDVDAKVQLEASGEGVGLNVAQAVGSACFSLGVIEIIVSKVLKDAQTY